MTGIRSGALATAALALVLATSSRASAQEAAGGVQTHDGFYLRLGIGVAYALGSAQYPELADPPDISVTGAGLAGELAVGGTVLPGLVLGGGSYGTGIFAPSYDDGDTALDGGLLTISTLGPFADYYLDPSGGLHVQAAILFATVSQAKGGDDLSQVREDSSGSGFGLMLGAGYEIWIGEQWSVGALARVTYVSASLEGEDTELEVDFSAFVPALLATFTYH